MSEENSLEKSSVREEFLKKIENMTKSANDKSEVIGREKLVNDELKIETLLFLKNQIAAEDKLSDLKLKAAARLTRYIDDEDGDLTPMVLVKIIETIGKIENDKAANILGVLKQQIVVQQNIQQNFPESSSFSSGEKLVTDDSSVNREDFKKLRKVYDFVHKLKQAEFNESDNQEETSIEDKGEE